MSSDSRTRRALPRAAAFWLVGAMTATLLAASSAPSPLYPVYQAEFRFSDLTLTIIFAVYVLVLLMSLLTVGRLSDLIGRRPVLAVALVVEAGAMALFWTAHSATDLFVSRSVQGLATGAAIGVLGAYLLDLQAPGGSRIGSLVNSVAPTAGLGVGAVVTGSLVQYAPYPTRLIFAIFTSLFLLLALATLVLPETVTRRPGILASLRPRVAVAASARSAFIGAVPTMIGTWALGGLMLSVGGSLLEVTFTQHNVAVIGLVIGVFAFCGALAAVAADRIEPGPMSQMGTAALATGTGLFLIAVATSSLPLFLVAAVVAGSGFGTGFLGALRSVTRLVAPDQRAALLSAVYIVSYVAFSVPAVTAGVLILHIGLRDTALIYGSFVALVALSSLAFNLIRGGRRHQPAGA